MAAYVKVTYSVSSTTSPTCVARYEWLSQQVEDWIDHVTIGSSGGTVITIEPWAPEGTDIWYYTYTFPTTGNQDLYFFSKTNEIPDRAFTAIEASYSPGYILSIDCSQSNNDITGIGESTFSLNYFMQSAYLSDNITKMGRNAFESASAMTVCNIPESLSAIPASMFQFCRSLEHVRIPDSVQSIGVSAFAGCTSLQDVYIGSGLTAFNTYSFGDCSSLISITATSKNVPITYYTNTFKNVHTGGTLYYPAGYESEYGPESGMLSTEEYLLGYYDWSGVTTGTPSASNIYCDWASAWTPNTSCNGYSDYESQLHVENCTLQGFSISFEIISGDSSFTCDVARTHNTQNWEPLGGIRARVSGNTTNETRVGNLGITFYDTSGNSYHQEMTITQAPCGSGPTPSERDISFSPGFLYDYAFGGTYISTAVPQNCVVSSITFERFSTVYGTWDEYPTYTLNGDTVTFQIPFNSSYGNRYSQAFFTITDTSGNTYTNKSISIFQSAPYEPGTGRLYVDGTELIAQSGSSSSSLTIVEQYDYYDHFTYMTGGGMDVAVTQGPGETLIFTIPANNTNNSRVGYVYLTLYDYYGYQFTQTITIRQAAGTSPGPGPEPETGYVLTSLTISDNEQHRYFVEAQPGIVYSAAGQYYKTISACEARYSLYYVNSYGGVDVLPFKEKSWKKNDTLTRFNYSRSFRNNTLEFENVNYMNEIKASWELHTGWMSDESSQRMHELVESTIVYLYDAEEKTYTPVVMTDKKLEYKTYHNQGKKFYNYTVNVEESQSKERR